LTGTPERTVSTNPRAAFGSLCDSLQLRAFRFDQGDEGLKTERALPDPRGKKEPK